MDDGPVEPKHEPIWLQHITKNSLVSIAKFSPIKASQKKK